MSLGLQRGKVKLTPYDPVWAALFAEEKQGIADVFGEKLLGIEHIGSTAIPGMDAKPILDLMIAVASIDDYEDEGTILEKVGYTFGRDMREEHQHVLFVKGPDENRTHYLKLTTLDSQFWQEKLLFRDYLISHPERAEAYRQLKHQLLEQYAGERAEYTDGKADFVKKTLQLAQEDFLQRR